jgi:2-hydroxychromene-2-carboxylate isomerase
MALQFWFDPASTYSYVAAMRVEDACARAGVALEWKPFLLGPIFSAQLGIKDSPFNVQPVRGRYMWRDLARLCEKYRLPWRRPSAFPRNSVLAARVACAAGPSIGAVTQAIFRANFAEDREIAHPERGPRELHLEAVALLRDAVVGLMARAAVVGRIHVAAAGQDERVDGPERLRNLALDRGQHDRHAADETHHVDVLARQREGLPFPRPPVAGDPDERPRHRTPKVPIRDAMFQHSGTCGTPRPMPTFPRQVPGIPRSSDWHELTTDVVYAT